MNSDFNDPRGIFGAAQNAFRRSLDVHFRQFVGKLRRGKAGVIGDTKPMPSCGVKIVKDFLRAGQRPAADINHAVHVKEDGAYLAKFFECGG